MPSMTATAHQLEALRGAEASGRLRKLSGGFWVVGDYPQVDRAHVPPASLSTHTIKACVNRGWFQMESFHTAHLTEVGRAVIAGNAEVKTDLPARDRLVTA